MIAVIEAKKAGLFRPEHWLPNIVSGTIVGIVALPLAMAFAIASGAKPEQGLYTAIIAGCTVSAFGGSRVQIAGPTAAFVVILSGITAKYGISGLQIATMMAGVMLLLFGLCRLGGIIKFIPDPVVVGFTAGIAVSIWVSQWKDFFGLPPATATHFHEKLFSLLRSLPQFHLATTAIATLSLFLVLYSSRILKTNKIPGPLVALVAATAVQWIFTFDGVVTIGSAFGGIPQGIPAPSIPEISLPRLIELIGPAFTIAMLGAIESLLSAVVADSMAGTRHNSNQELVGQGIANIVAPLFGGFAATGAIARTATNVRNGGTSPLSGIVHSLTLLLVLLFLAPLASSIPLASLAAILFVVAWNMSERKHFIKILRRAPRSDAAILVVTFLLTVFADLVVAVNIGVILATLSFLARMASSVEVQRIDADALSKELGAGTSSALPADVLVYAVEGPFFFGAVETFERALAYVSAEPRVMIIRLKWVPFIDASGLQALEEAVVDLQKKGVRVILSGANAKVQRKLERGGITALVGGENCVSDFAEAVRLASGAKK